MSATYKPYSMQFCGEECEADTETDLHRLEMAHISKCAACQRVVLADEGQGAVDQIRAECVALQIQFAEGGA